MNYKNLKKLITTFTVPNLFFLAIASPAAYAQELSNYGMEITYQDSAFQCSSTQGLADIKAVFYNSSNRQIIRVLSQGESAYFPVDSLADLNIAYTFENADCRPENYYFAKGTELLQSDDPIPNFPGIYGQTDVSDMLSNLESYEQLYLVELGTSNHNSAAYDLQDVVLVIDNNPTLPACSILEDSNSGQGNNPDVNLTLNDGTRITGSYDVNNSGNAINNNLNVSTSDGTRIQYSNLSPYQKSEFDAKARVQVCNLFSDDENLGFLNNSPNLMNDYAQTSSNKPVIIDVLANDSDLDGDTLDLESFNIPIPTEFRGNVEIINDNGVKKIRYTPEQAGTYNFTYTAIDSFGGTDTTNVTVDVFVAD